MNAIAFTHGVLAVFGEPRRMAPGAWGILRDARKDALLRTTAGFVAGRSLILPLVPPREIIGHVGRHLVLELRGALFQERDDAFLDVIGAAAGVDAAAVDLVGFHRIVGARHAPHHLP